MIYDNPLLTKESLKEAASHIGEAVFTLIYDSNGLLTQISAGQELRQAGWILATIIDHVFDYYPRTYFMNEDDKKEYPKFLDWFMQHPEVGVRNAIKFAKSDFAVLETITCDEFNEICTPHRKAEKEEHVIAVLQEIQENLPEIISLLSRPKKVSDADKPTADEIKGLISAIQKIKKTYWDLSEQRGDSDSSLQAFQISNILDGFTYPLFMAWQVYHYGWHSDFWKEGDSMFGYMFFEMQAKKVVTDLIKLLEEHSPFAMLERDSAITNGLLKVYKHLLTQKL